MSEGDEGELDPSEVEEVNAAYAAQRAHLRRILVAFVIVVVLLPLAAIDGVLQWLLLPMLATAAFGLREGLRLRRSVLRYGNLR